jgi:hypothetical protein
MSSPSEGEPSAINAITIGLDITKSVFQVHAEDASGKVVMQRRLRARLRGFSPSNCPVLWASKRAAGRITGSGRCVCSVTTCG